MAGPGSDVRIPDTPARRFRTSDRRTEGVTSVSFFGTDPELNTPVVVKVLRPEAFPSPLERQRIVRELKRQVSVPHPSLARVIAADEEGGVVWVARDWIEGQPLSDRIERGTITADEAARWTSQLAEALGELHRVMLLHRDVRPAHIILALDGRARLIDASCGRFFRGADGKPVFGTPGFVAPEAASGKLVNARSDLYSLGATAFAMLQGAPPFGTGDDATLIERALRADAPKPTRGPDGLIAAVTSMLAREPRERPFHAQQVVQQLEPFFTAMRSAAAGVDEDGPPTSAVDEAMVSKAFAINAGPSIVDDEFDDAEVTEVGRTNAEESAKPAAPASVARVPSPSVNSAAIRAPAPSPNTGAHAVAVAPSSAPAMSMSQSSQSVVRKATLMGMAPVPTGPASFSAPTPMPAVTAAPSTDPAVREDSGSRATGGTDFDEEENTVVSQDSRIFGHSQPHAQSAHGTAVPPLPDDISKRVLQKGGNVTAPVEARPVSIPPPPSRKVTGSIRVPAPPVGVPSLPRPEPVPQFTPLPSNGEATMTANVAAVVSASETSGPNPAIEDAQSNISITEPSGPGFEMHQPQPVVGAPPYQPQAYAQQYPQQPAQYPQQQYPQQQGMQYPQAAQQSAPPQGMQYPQPPATASAQPGYPAGVAGYSPQGSTAAYPAPPPNPTGAYPSPQPHPTGAYPAGPHPTGAYGAVNPNGTAAWPQQPPKKSSLLPWIAAGCLIALVAGGTGYALAMRHRVTEGAIDSQPNNSTQTQTTPGADNAQQAAQIAAQNALLAAADAAAAMNAATNGAVAINNNGATQTINAVAMDSGVASAVVNAQPVDSGVLVAANTQLDPQPNPNNGSAEPNNGAVGNPAGNGTNSVIAPPNGNNTVAANTHTQSTSRAVTPPPAQTPMQQARAAFAHRDYAQARQILESWVRSHPSDAQALLLLGDVRFAQGERRPAGDAYRSAIAAGNYGSPYWRRLVERQMSIGDRTGAINTLNDVLRHKPGDRDATRRLQEIQGGGAATSTGARATSTSSVTAFGAPNRTVRR